MKFKDKINIGLVFFVLHPACPSCSLYPSPRTSLPCSLAAELNTKETENGVNRDIVQRIYEEIPDCQNIIRFHGTLVKYGNVFCPYEKYGLPCADFHEINKCSPELYVDPLYGFSPKSENKCGM